MLSIAVVAVIIVVFVIIVVAEKGFQCGSFIRSMS